MLHILITVGGPAEASPDGAPNKRGASKKQTKWEFKDMRKFFTKVSRDQKGATAIEYGLIAAGIAVVIITAVQLVGTNLTATFSTVAAAIHG